MNLDLVHALAIAAALGWASGLRLYAAVFLTGLAGALGWVELPPGLVVLQNPWMLGASGVMLVVEFFADKIPGLDTVWDVLHTLVRIPAGAALAAGAFGGDTATWTTIAAVLGGTLAAASHAAKATTRAAINTSPEPFTNVGASLLGDGAVPVLLWLSWSHPVAALVIVALALVVSIAVCVVLGRFFRGLLRRWRGRSLVPTRVDASSVAVSLALASAVAGMIAWSPARAQSPVAEPASVSSMPAGAEADAATDTAARDMREEVQRIPITLKDLYGHEETLPIVVTIFSPRGDGPFPLAIVNHGRAVDAQRSRQGRQRFEDLSRYLVSKGFAVLVPTRVGYGETYGEFDPEASGGCNAKRLAPMADAIFAEVMATREFARTLSFVDATRWIVVGQSVGGFGSVITVGRHPPGLVAGINFAGGTGGDPDTRPQDPCSPQAVGRLWHELAAGAAVPMLWLYWQNDMFWGPKIPKSWYADWTSGGGKAELHTLAPAGTNGHSGSTIDMDHWVPIVEPFLDSLGFTQPGLVARPASSGFAAVADVDKVPLPPASRDSNYRKYLDGRMPRAFAIGPNNAWGWATGDWALGKALGRCERRGQPCKLYAVDDEVVWAP